MEPTVDDVAPDLDAWNAWHPTEAAEILARCPVPWFVAGGWAIDLWLGRQTRAHEDLEIAIPRSAAASYRGFIASLGRFDLYDAGSGQVRRLAGGQPSNPDNHQLWHYERAARVWRMDAFLEPGDERTWVSHRDQTVRVPMADAVRHDAAGIAYLAPAIVLFTKAKHARDKDGLDLAVSLPTLDSSERSWLAETIATVHPGHRWLDQIAGPDTGAD